MTAPLPTAREGLALSPRVATVRAAGDVLALDLDGEALEAADGLVGLWTPRPGDRVLVSWAQGAWYVTGLIARAPGGAEGFVVERRPDGRGAIVRAPDGDLELRADRGDVRIRAAGAVHVDAPVGVRVAAEVIEATAVRAVVRARDLYQEVDDLVQTRAGRVRTLVRGAWHLFARRAIAKADDDVKLKGEKIHLG